MRAITKPLVEIAMDQDAFDREQLDRLLEEPGGGMLGIVEIVQAPSGRPMLQVIFDGHDGHQYEATIEVD